MSETNTMREIMLALSPDGARVFRNNVGVAVYPDGSRVKYGLCNGSSDIIGFVPVTVTPDMVGQRVAIFLAVEVKDPKGRSTEEQEAFIRMVKMRGGIAGVARSVADALALVRARFK